MIGNFGFGIDEHIDLGMKFDPSTGIYGMDFYASLSRPGKRVGSRKKARGVIGKRHRVVKADAIKWFKERLGGTVL